MERLTLKKLNEVEGKEQCHVKVANKFDLWKTVKLLVRGHTKERDNCNIQEILSV
jgi:hypothetical protein